MKEARSRSHEGRWATSYRASDPIQCSRVQKYRQGKQTCGRNRGEAERSSKTKDNLGLRRSRNAEEERATARSREVGVPSGQTRRLPHALDAFPRREQSAGCSVHMCQHSDSLQGTSGTELPGQINTNRHVRQYVLARPWPAASMLARSSISILCRVQLESLLCIADSRLLAAHPNRSVQCASRFARTPYLMTWARALL